MKKLMEWWETNRLNLLKKFKEYFALILVLLGFFIIPYVLRWIDPTTAAFDPGILQTIFVVLIAFSIYQFVVWSVVKTLWKGVGDYMKSGLFTNDFKDLDKRTKVVISLSVYFVLFSLLVLLTNAVL